MRMHAIATTLARNQIYISNLFTNNYQLEMHYFDEINALIEHIDQRRVHVRFAVMANLRIT